MTQPLDPDEGPTVWVEPVGESAYKILAGTDPDDPVATILLSAREIDRLHSLTKDESAKRESQ